ncbi:hypothetical protein [Hyphomicrobium sulfonivorans]|uniref:hypothetical protein n=1 Tax=Hyphomicrobium sulfonivorans TaxID=121290 RepID=UPI00156E3E47|nr:hypothetical protein [Hyphomicrobium sulfonivorans]MBI1649693.1 hypothetical protein [Hyphomicrobium sulfonivorans]NSL71607.1 hypothetical protein [Hyphomicrobium sulfonivorans]
MQRIAAWHAAPDSAVACPVCDAQGLTVLDRSARPYAEWYVLVCNACGLEHTLQIPMAPLTPPIE